MLNYKVLESGGTAFFPPAESHLYDPRIEEPMARPTRKIKKANHGKRPANNRGRKARRKAIRT